jgi:hypothetical protein
MGECRQDDWTRKLAAWAAAGITAYLDSVPLHDLVFHEFETDGSHPDIVLEYLTDMLQHGAATGAWSVEDPRLMAVYLFHGLHGVVEEAVAGNRPVKRTQLIGKVQRMCFRLVGSAPA